MPRPYDAYIAQQERKAEVLDASIRKDERERIIALLDEADIYGRPVVLQRDRLIALINGENE